MKTETSIVRGPYPFLHFQRPSWWLINIPLNNWAARWGNPSRASIIYKTAGGGEYSKHNPRCLFLSPPRTDLSGKVKVLPSLHRGNLSVDVKIINTIHIVIVSVLSAVMQHGNHSSGSADSVLLDAERSGSTRHHLLKTFDWTCWVVWGNIVSSRVWHCNMNNVREWELIMCGLETFGSDNKDSTGLNQ